MSQERNNNNPKTQWKKKWQTNAHTPPFPGKPKKNSKTQGVFIAAFFCLLTTPQAVVERDNPIASRARAGNDNGATKEKKKKKN